MREIDGAMGEGGGQVLRTALALAAATTTPVRVARVRAHRPEPGLRPQHLAGLTALASVCDARVDGLEVGATDVTFQPGPLVGGDYEIHVGTAGAITLVLQTLLPALAASRQRFELTLTGGTDVPFAPTWDWTREVHFPALRALGVDVEATLVRRGYFPAGGGEARVTVDAGGLRPADFVERGALVAVEGHAHCHGIPRAVAERGAEALADRLTRASLPPKAVGVEQHRGPGAGFGLAAWARYERATVGADALGKRGLPAEAVAARAATALRREHEAGCAVDEHEADALPTLLALAGGGAFTTRTLTPHARTVLAMLPLFLPVRVGERAEGGGVRVDVRRAPA